MRQYNVTFIQSQHIRITVLVHCASNTYDDIVADAKHILRGFYNMDVDLYPWTNVTVDYIGEGE